MPPTSKIDAGVRADAQAKARKTGQIQPVKDTKGNVAYYVDGTGNMVADPHPPKGKPKAKDSGSGQLDPESRASAIQQAKVTGKVQPVRDKAGNLLYYVDQAGNAGADPDAKSIPSAHDATQATSDQWLNDHGYRPDPAAAAKPDPNAATPPESDEQIRQGIAQYDSDRNQFFNGGGNTTLGGVDPTSTTDPLGINGASAQAGANGLYNTKTSRNADGTWQVLAGDGKTNLTDSYFGQTQVANQQANATFAALALPQQFSANTTLLFSQGAGSLTPQGTQVVRTKQGGLSYTSKQDDRQDLQAGPRGLAQNQPMNSQQQLDQAQHMTLGQGLQWFVNLSVTDPQAYSQLVVGLNKAGYFADQTGGQNYVPESKLPLSGYSRNAGQALVEAMQDLSVAQGAGETSDMARWLQKRSTGYEDYVNSGAGYNPVNRSYQDPATLAATAKNAAQQALGRNLTAAEEARFEAAFHGKESAAYNEIDQYGRAKAVANFTDKSGLPAGTPTGYTMPDTSGEADQYVNNNPQFAAEKQGYSGLELTKGLIGFLKGGGF